MKKFIVTYHVPESALKDMKDSDPEETKKSMEKWMDWAKKCGPSLLDLGTPLGNTQIVTPNGATPGEPTLCGYSILQAENMAGATSMLKEHPHLGWKRECTIQIHEALPMPS
jgi:hypothetical protein